MGKRYIKDEGGKKVVYEKPDPGIMDFLVPDRRIGEITKTSPFDVGINSTHILTHDGLLSGPRDQVNAEGTLILPLRTASYVAKNNEGDTTEYRYNTWNDRYETSETEGFSNNSSGPSNPSPSSAPVSNSYRGSSANGTATPSSALRHKAPDTVGKGMKVEKNTKAGQNNGAGLALAFLLIVVALVALSGAAKPQPEVIELTEPRKPILPPKVIVEIDQRTWRLPRMPDGFVKFFICFGSSAFIGFCAIIYGLLYPHATTLANQIHFAIANTLFFPSLIPLFLCLMLECARRIFFKEWLINGGVQSDQEFNAAFEQMINEKLIKKQ